MSPDSNSPESLRVLLPEETAAFADMTFGPSRHLLKTCGTGGNSVAIGAEVPTLHGNKFHSSEPVGLALVEIHPQRPSAVLRSLFVEEQWRMRGIGTRLLQAVESELRGRDIKVIGATYISDSPGFAATEAVLRRCNWATGKPRMRIGRFNIGRILDMPWLKLEAGPRYEVIPWQEVTAKDHAEIRAWPDFPAALSPFAEPALQEPRVSTALRVRATGRIVGWMVTHLVLPDTVRYSALYVRPEIPVLGRGLPLLARAICRQGEVRDVLLHALAGVSVANEAMSSTLLRRLRPYSEGIATSYEARKDLSE